MKRFNIAAQATFQMVYVIISIIFNKSLWLFSNFIGATVKAFTFPWHIHKAISKWIQFGSTYVPLIVSTPQWKTRQCGTHRPSNDMAHLQGTCLVHYYRKGMLIVAKNDTDNRENRILKIENIFYHFTNIHSRAQDKATHVATNTLLIKAAPSRGQKRMLNVK